MVLQELVQRGEEAVLDVKGVADQDVYACIRPEGFVLDCHGPMTCGLSRVEVMGRDISVVCTHSACENVSIRAIIGAENDVDADAETVRFALKPGKVHLFSKDTEQRIDFEAL